MLVIGGGITGAGVALDAAVARPAHARSSSATTSRRARRRSPRSSCTAVCATSSNASSGSSTRASHERQIALRERAPPRAVLPFLIPVLIEGRADQPRSSPGALGTALWMYDLTGGAAHRQAPPAHQARKPRSRTCRRCARRTLAAAYLYYDAQADDARLTLTIARTAAAYRGAVVANHAGVAGLVKDAVGSGHRRHGRGRRARRIEVERATVVNATGVWSDDVRALDEGDAPDSIRPAKGIHITVPWTQGPQRHRRDHPGAEGQALGLRGAVGRPHRTSAPPTPTTTARSTTRSARPRTSTTCSSAINVVHDRAAHRGRHRSARGPGCGRWSQAAARERTADLSRRHRCHRRRAGVVTVTGGKLTTYRRMAADTVDAVVKSLGRRRRSAAPKRLPLLGADGSQGTAIARGSAPQRRAPRPPLRRRSRATLLASSDDDPALARAARRRPPLPARRGGLRGPPRDGDARSTTCSSRRTRARLLGRDATAARGRVVAELIAAELGWDAEQQRQIDGRLVTGTTLARRAGCRRDRARRTSHRRHRSVAPVSHPSSGAPTPPIALATPAADVRDRARPRAGSRCDDALLRAAAATRARP